MRKYNVGESKINKILPETKATFPISSYDILFSVIGDGNEKSLNKQFWQIK